MKSGTILFFILSFISSMVAFYVVYRYMGQLFQRQKFPYPFEYFGIAAGLGASCWTYAICKMLRWVACKFQKLSSSPYMVETKVKINSNTSFETEREISS